MSIPKIIHYCWFGGNPLPKSVEKCIASWKKYCPDYRIIEWNESNFDLNCCPYCAAMLEKKKWAFLSDYARLKIIYEQGGVYLDTDVELVRSLDPLVEQGAYMGFENGDRVATGLGFAAEAGHPFLRENMAYYEELTDFEVLKACPHITTDLLEAHGLVRDRKKLQRIAGMTIYPEDYLCPKDERSGLTVKTKNTYSIHHFDASWFEESWKKGQKKRWRQEKLRYILKTPNRLLIKLLGQERYEKFKRMLGWGIKWGKKQFSSSYNRCVASLRLAKKRRGRKLRVLNSVESIKYIIKNHCSVSRYGDGEFNIVFNKEGINFQRGSVELSDRLNNVLCEENPQLLICIPYAINCVHGMNEHAQRFYQSWAMYNYPRLASKLIQNHGKRHVYGDTSMTRPYKDWKSINHAKRVFKAIRKVWEGKDILIVEGCKTRLGVGNDLFDNAKSIKRVLAPAENAFECYDEIMQTVLEKYKNELIIIALGPTATVLASDLSKCEIQAIDVGHIDIEYEWYLRKAESKDAIPGKYTNEASDGNCVAACEDPVYLSQIIAKVGIP